MSPEGVTLHPNTRKEKKEVETGRWFPLRFLWMAFRRTTLIHSPLVWLTAAPCGLRAMNTLLRTRHCSTGWRVCPAWAGCSRGASTRTSWSLSGPHLRRYGKNSLRKKNHGDGLLMVIVVVVMMKNTCPHAGSNPVDDYLAVPQNYFLKLNWLWCQKGWGPLNWLLLLFSCGTGTCGCGCRSRGKAGSASFPMSPAPTTLGSSASTWMDTSTWDSAVTILCLFFFNLPENDQWGLTGWLFSIW